MEVVKSAINNTFETYYKYGRSHISKAYSSYKLVKGLGLNVLKGYNLAVKGLGYYYDCTALFYSYHKTSLITSALAYLAYYTAENYYNKTQSQLNQKKETELELIRCALTSIKIKTYDNTVCVRIVEATDGMTATFAHIPHEILETISRRIINEVDGVNRVVYDISSKPPAIS